MGTAVEQKYPQIRVVYRDFSLSPKFIPGLTPQLWAAGVLSSNPAGFLESARRDL